MNKELKQILLDNDNKILDYFSKKIISNKDAILKAYTEEFPQLNDGLFSLEIATDSYYNDDGYDNTIAFYLNESFVEEFQYIADIANITESIVNFFKLKRVDIDFTQNLVQWHWKK